MRTEDRREAFRSMPPSSDNLSTKCVLTSLARTFTSSTALSKRSPGRRQPRFFDAKSSWSALRRCLSRQSVSVVASVGRSPLSLQFSAWTEALVQLLSVTQKLSEPLLKTLDPRGDGVVGRDDGGSNRSVDQSTSTVRIDSHDVEDIQLYRDHVHSRSSMTDMTDDVPLVDLRDLLYVLNK